MGRWKFTLIALTCVMTLSLFGCPLPGHRGGGPWGGPHGRGGRGGRAGRHHKPGPGHGPVLAPAVVVTPAPAAEPAPAPAPKPVVRSRSYAYTLGIVSHAVRASAFAAGAREIPIKKRHGVRFDLAGGGTAQLVRIGARHRHTQVTITGLNPGQTSAAFQQIQGNVRPN